MLMGIYMEVLILLEALYFSITFCYTLEYPYYGYSLGSYGRYRLYSDTLVH